MRRSTGSIRGADGNLIEFSTLTQEEKRHVREKIAKNIGRTIGRYLSEHPEEIEPFSRCEGVRLIPDQPLAPEHAEKLIAR